MAEGLPEGLITQSEAITGEIERVDRVTAEEIIKLWKGISFLDSGQGIVLLWTDHSIYQVYSANKAVLADDVGRRLENFFWRIWGNKKIRDRITGSQVAVLFSNISEGGFLRTTPTQSPRTSRSLGSYESNRRVEKVPDSSPPNTPADLARSQGLSREEQVEDGLAVRASDDVIEPLPISRTISAEQTKDVALPPSILKKPKMGSSSQVPKTARILSQNAQSSHRDVSGIFDGEYVSAEEKTSPVETSRNKGKASSRGQESSSIDATRSSITSDAIKSTTNISFSDTITTEDQGTRSQEDERQKSARRRTIIHAKTAVSKRRPAIAQRKSSQSSSNNASNTTLSPSSRSKTTSLNKSTDPASASDGSSDGLAENLQSQTTRVSRLENPHPSKQLRRRAGDDNSGEDSEENTPSKEYSKPTDGLVDRDFRSKFATKTQIDRQPFASVPPMAYKSATAAATSASYQASGTVGFGQPQPPRGKGKRSVEFTDEIIPLKPPGASGPDEIDEDEDEDGPLNLPRTKSQLTFLLEKDKKRNEDENQGKTRGAPR